MVIHNRYRYWLISHIEDGVRRHLVLRDGWLVSLLRQSTNPPYIHGIPLPINYASLPVHPLSHAASSKGVSHNYMHAMMMNRYLRNTRHRTHGHASFKPSFSSLSYSISLLFSYIQQRRHSSRCNTIQRTSGVAAVGPISSRPIFCQSALGIIYAVTTPCPSRSVALRRPIRLPLRAKMNQPVIMMGVVVWGLVPVKCPLRLPPFLPSHLPISTYMYLCMCQVADIIRVPICGGHIGLHRSTIVVGFP